MENLVPNISSLWADSHNKRGVAVAQVCPGISETEVFAILHGTHSARNEESLRGTELYQPHTHPGGRKLK